MRKILIFVCLLAVLDYALAFSSEAGAQLKIVVGETEIFADLIDNETAKDFVNLLPLTLNASDIRNREKLAYLPKSVSQGGALQKIYEIGDISYWPPGPGIAIFFAHDGRTVESGLIRIAKLNAAGVEFFGTLSESFKMEIELAE